MHEPETKSSEAATAPIEEDVGEEPGAVVRAMKQHARRLDPAQQREAEALLGEFAAWERTRERLARRAAAPVRQTVGTQPVRTIAFFDGVPGAGKTTHIERLVAEVGADYLSMARFAEARDVSQGERREQQLANGTLHRTDLEFLAAVMATTGTLLVLEKFPRTPVEAEALVEQARRERWRLVGIHLFFPEEPIASSVRRQLDRGPRRGKGITEREATRRAMTSLARGSSGRWALRDLGVPIHGIDSTRPQQENDERIRRLLGLDFDSLPWDLEPLQELDEVCRSAGVEAWVSSGGVYRPFWNGRFGPIQLPTDVDVAVERQEEVGPLAEALRLANPRRRWSVLCPGEVLRRRHGIETASIAEAKAHAAFLHRAGAVRWHRGALEVRLCEGAEAALRNGVVRLNDRFFAALDGRSRAAELALAADKIRRTLRDYPGLRVEAATAARLGLEAHQPRRILTAWRPLKEEVIRTQHDPRTAAFCRRALDGRERELAQEVLRFHQQSDFRPGAPLRPPRSALPESLESIRAARERSKAGLRLTEAEERLVDAGEVPAPAGYASWLHCLALEAGDDVFREWILDQTHHHRPTGGADRFLQRLLDCSLFEELPIDTSREQSPMHQGWPLERHVAASLLELDTDALRPRFESGAAGPGFRELRLCMRMAVLFHDTGKLVRPRGASRGAPRRHALISARLWTRHRPDWFPEHLVPLVRWMVETHDLFGAFGRGLTEKRGRPVGDYEVDLALATSYFSALDAQAVRERLLDSGLPLPDTTAINKAIWRADIGSISSLRWLLPIAELVERLVLEGSGRERRASRESEGERRQRARPGGEQRRRGGRRRTRSGGTA